MRAPFGALDSCSVKCAVYNFADGYSRGRAHRHLDCYEDSFTGQVGTSAFKIRKNRVTNVLRKR